MNEADVRAIFDHYAATGEFIRGIYTDDFVWDMSTFGGWPEQQEYHGMEQAERFMAAWTAQFDEWGFEVLGVEMHGDQVLIPMRQWGTPKVGGPVVDMRLAHVWTVREGLIARVAVYGSVQEARGAVAAR